MKDLANHVATAIANKWKQVAYQLERSVCVAVSDTKNK